METITRLIFEIRWSKYCLSGVFVCWQRQSLQWKLGCCLWHRFRNIAWRNKIIQRRGNIIKAKVYLMPLTVSSKWGCQSIMQLLLCHWLIEIAIRTLFPQTNLRFLKHSICLWPALLLIAVRFGVIISYMRVTQDTYIIFL